jgi:hypothetical protein
VRLVALVDRDEDAGEALEGASVRERPGVVGAAVDGAARELEREGLRVLVVAAHERVLLAAEGARRDRVQTGGDGSVEDLGNLLRDGRNALDAELARDAEERGRADCVPEVARRGERGGGVAGEHDEVGAGDRVLVPRAGDTDLCGDALRLLGVARADHDVVALLEEPVREGGAELPRPAEDRDPHAARTASASRRRASRSDISVFVTTGRTARFSTSRASASSTTSTSIRSP